MRAEPAGVRRPTSRSAIDQPKSPVGVAAGTPSAERVVVADGAMGTMLQQQSLTLDDFEGLEGCNEILNVTRPDVVRAIHDAYFEVGADCVETNTFGANFANLGEYDIADRIHELAGRGAPRSPATAADAVDDAGPAALGARARSGPAPSCRRSATSRSPTLRDAYQEQVARHARRRRRRRPGRDRAGPAAGQGGRHRRARGRMTGGATCATVPLIVNVTVETTGTMLLGTEIGAALTALEPLGIDLIGLNCATGPAEMSEHLRYLSRHSGAAVACMPNAGLPQLTADGAHYPLTPERARRRARHVHPRVRARPRRRLLRYDA